MGAEVWLKITISRENRGCPSLESQKKNMSRDTVFSASTITFYLDLHPFELGGGRTSHPLCKSNCWLVEMKVQDVLSGHETVVFAWTSGSPVDARPVYNDSDADTLLSGWKGGGRPELGAGGTSDDAARQPAGLGEPPLGFERPPSSNDLHHPRALPGSPPRHQAPGRFPLPTTSPTLRHSIRVVASGSSPTMATQTPAVVMDK